MESIYNEKLSKLGYSQLVCDIFLDWENVKDEVLLTDRKSGSGNGTVHVFIGAADKELRKEFPDYYSAVERGEDPKVGAVKVTHYFLRSNILSLIGAVCKYYVDKSMDFTSIVRNILESLKSSSDIDGMIATGSYFKLSIGAAKLRPYFKQFDDNGAFPTIIRKLLLPNSAYKISLYKNADNQYAAFWLIGFDGYKDFEADTELSYLKKDKHTYDILLQPLQQIFYGAPGTGKSYAIKKATKGHDVIRTTFHPDSDYSTFVGAYKPTTAMLPICDGTGKPMTIGSTTLHKEQVVYEFVAQAFLNAYVEAWKKCAAAAEGEAPKAQFLVIEEINRGNCAQIFGDLFQLLDRNDEGFSDYAIKADSDMKRQLKKAFCGLSLKQSAAINGLYEGRDVVSEVLSGEILLLPNNLYIWATMNTSDQSLFPIDSAFKRRWEWKYVPIRKAEKGWLIKVGSEKYDWWTFVQKINEVIYGATNSQDKKLGYFFVKTPDGIVSTERLVGKVFFYLWNDVFKDYEVSADLLKNGDSTIEFADFYNPDASPNTETVRTFLQNLGLAAVETAEEDKDAEGTGQLFG